MEDAFSIRPMRGADYKAADLVFRAAFNIPESRQADLIRNVKIQPDGWFVAERSGGLVGLIGIVSYTSFAYIGQLAVLPEFQSRGIGRKLMEHVLGWARVKGVPSLLLDATEKGFPLYTSLGFSTIDLSCVYAVNGMLSVEARLDRRSPEVLPLSDVSLDELALFDAPFFGGDRSRVLGLLLRDFPGGSFAARDSRGRLSGYLILQGRKLGPWAARTPAAAERLLSVALASGLPENLFAVVPGANPDADRLLKKWGFEVFVRNRHMLLGPEPLRLRSKIYGQASFAIG
jgi:GNAT superfamily N-acetyltransferase